MSDTPRWVTSWPEWFNVFGNVEVVPAADYEELQDVLRRNGFVECDIAACNCGSWHARYGLSERMAEIEEILAESGHPVSNENGNLPLNALHELVVERNKLNEELEKLNAALRHYGWGQGEIDSITPLWDELDQLKAIHADFARRLERALAMAMETLTVAQFIIEFDNGTLDEIIAIDDRSLKSKGEHAWNEKWIESVRLFRARLAEINAVKDGR
jgi:hypothetical protein